MSLLGALNTGKSALAVSQAALQTTGNNISNAGNADYTRERAEISSAESQKLAPGKFVGTGVNLDSVQREIDDALESRLRSATSEDSGASTKQTWLGQVQSVFNELTDDDLSTQASDFFNSWSSLANNPADSSLRQVVITNGQTIANTLNDMQGQFVTLQHDINSQVSSIAGNANSLAQKIADLNTQIVTSEGANAGTNNSLRDDRDADLKQLSTLMDIRTITEPNGTVDVYVGSQPLVAGTVNNGVSTKNVTINDKVQTVVTFANDNSNMILHGGQLGALQSSWQSAADVMDQMDKYAGSLINELNKVYSSGQGTAGFTSVTGANQVLDTSAALNSTAAGLDFKPTTGSFVVHVTNPTTGLSTSTLVQVDLDGQNANDTSLQSLQQSLSNISGVNATIAGGKLSLNSTDSSAQISFSQDSSGVLASLGVNTFFSGSNAHDISVNSTISNNTALLAAAQNGESGDNQTATAIAALGTASLKSLNGSTLNESYESVVNDLATKVAASKTAASAASSVKDTLDAQRQAVSGVSIDEEAVNLMTQQRAFQGAAKVISTVNQMMDTLMAMF